MHDYPVSVTCVSCATIICQILLLLCATAAAAVTDNGAATLLFCSSTIATSGVYNVSCSNESFFFYVIGCADDSANGSSGNAGLVSVNFLTSPYQVVVSDYPVFVSQSKVGGLAGCSVHITYLAPIPSALSMAGNVFVALTSPLLELRVLLLTSLMLGGGFVWVRGVNEPNASIGLLSVVAGPQSSIVCSGSYTNQPRCLVSYGAALVVLTSSPPISNLSVVLNGTDVTRAMWSSQSDTSNISSFALVQIDNSTNAIPNIIPVAKTHSILLQNVVGTVVGSRLLALLYSQYPGSRMSSTYPQFHGALIARNCSFVGDSPVAAIFDLSDIASASITLVALHVQSFLVSIVRVNTTFDAAAASSCSSTPLSLTIAESSLVA
ncbi:GPI-anchored surface protein, putative [Bodo saltans]|uniref:GPI-anchored surface protein, putative n=1 Tax=Bodo saltans TaxID=75058 RepID=A0A0S4J7V4_BODSA|nr:GPI-anchored surface protein, putative [Bodo saltans]|eukprot:CUG87324.1 GPI-anchored surface protein, putative [Bodo saltans]